MNTRLLLFPRLVGNVKLGASQNLKSSMHLNFFLERLLNPMVITYSPYYFVYKDLLNASSNHL